MDEWVCVEGRKCKVAHNNLNRKSRKKSKKSSSTGFFENMQYKSGNFRGALQEYYEGQGTLIFDEVEVREKDNERVFLSKCRIEDNESIAGNEGSGYGKRKKQAMQFSALDLILKLKLVTQEQHREMHPENFKL